MHTPLCQMGLYLCGQGRGRSKKEAEQNAAKAAIEKLRAGE